MTTLKMERELLDVASFPANLQNHVKPDAPPPLKMMAARGMVPAPGEWTLRLLYQLSFDKGVGKEAVKALKQMPGAILAPSLKGELPEAVLDWIAELRAEDDEVLEALVLSRHTSDVTIARIAALASAPLADTIATNQMRILRAPVILEELYKNVNTRVATVDKLIELAQRNAVRLDGLPGLQAALDSGESLTMGSSEDIEGFEELLRGQQGEEAEEDEEEDGRALSRLEKIRLERQKSAQKEEEPTGPLYHRIQQMNLGQKIRLATTGNREAIMMLVRENNRLVHMAAIKSPRLKLADVRKLAAHKSAADGVIRYIAGNREWTQHYDIKLNLANNPKTPLPDAMSIVNHLRTGDLRLLMRNRNVPHQLARQAKMLVGKRSN